MKQYSVSLSRQFGSLGRPIAKEMAEILGVDYYDREIVEKAAKKMNMSVGQISQNEESARNPFGYMRFPLGRGTTEVQDKIFKVQRDIILDIARKESCLIVGRCSDSILEDFENHFNIFVYAPYEARVTNCVNQLGMTPKVAKKMIAEVDTARDAYHMRYVKYLPADMDHIDLMINGELLGVNGTAAFLSDLIKRKFAD